MDYQKFIEQLPSRYENWGKDSVKPKSNQFQQVLDQVQGITTVNVMQLLNFAVECMEPDEIYCEIGSYQGSTLIGALLNHPHQMAYAVDNFCEDNPFAENFDKLIENLSNFSLQEQVYFCNQDFEQFLLELRDLDTEDKIGVYFYDGPHDYRSQLLGLLLVKPFLAEKALIVVDGSNWGNARQAIWDFLAANHECQILLDLPWNGISILSWDKSRGYNYSSPTFSEVRQQPVIQAIYELEMLEKRGGISDFNQKTILLHFGNKFYQEGKYQEAIELFQKVLKLQTGEPQLYVNLSECFRNCNRLEDAISILREGIRCHPMAGQLHFYLIVLLQQNGLTQDAISTAETASQLLPNEYVFKIFKYLILPIVYDSLHEIAFFRKHFVQGLQKLVQETSLETPEEKRNAFVGIGCVTNFYLAYQAHNVVESQCQYGNLVHQIMGANYPQWIKPLPMPPLKKQNKIRIGYISAYLHSYSGTLWLVGWLRYCDKQQFEIYCYYTGNKPDLITQQLRDDSDVFHHIPNNLEAVCEQVISDQLHILVFPEIGMDAPIMQIAGLRLAPVQCTAWGHPVTSGLPTIDYFLSSKLMEPEDAQEHYSEKLIRLPNIGVAYPKPSVGKLTKTRADFQLPDDAVLYLCCQAPFKYLPQYDFIFAEIALRVPQAKFIFLRGSLLKQRLQRAFYAVGLNSKDYCLFLTIPTRPDYLAINFLSDVFLDTFTWSGGNTSLEAIACNLPIVTWRAEFMRGLHAYSFLKMIGVTDTIAQTEAEYIEIAAKLGLESEWRLEIVKQISDRYDYLYDDKVCVEGLEDFYRQVVQEKLTMQM